MYESEIFNIERKQNEHRWYSNDLWRLPVKQGFQWQQLAVSLMATRMLKRTLEKKVLEVIERLDYRPNAVARGLASKKTTTVGVVIPNITNGYFSTLAKGIDDIAEMYKYNIVLANSDEDDEKEVSVVNTLFSKQVDGIIFMGYHLTEKIRQNSLVHGRRLFLQVRWM